MHDDAIGRRNVIALDDAGFRAILSSSPNPNKIKMSSRIRKKKALAFWVEFKQTIENFQRSCRKTEAMWNQELWRAETCKCQGRTTKKLID